MTVTGRCLCGDIRYTITGDPMATAVCHCEHCQRQSGSAFSINLMLHESQLSVDGDLSTFEETDDAGDTVFVRRRFCGSCGSAVVSEMVQTEGMIAVKAGTLDDKSGISPIAQVWCVDKQPWVDLPGISISMDRES